MRHRIPPALLAILALLVSPIIIEAGDCQVPKPNGSACAKGLIKDCKEKDIFIRCRNFLLPDDDHHSHPCATIDGHWEIPDFNELCLDVTTVQPCCMTAPDICLTIVEGTCTSLVAGTCTLTVTIALIPPYVSGTAGSTVNIYTCNEAMSQIETYRGTRSKLIACP